MRPLIGLTKKDRKWDWTTEAEEAFKNLKLLFCTAPVLALFDLDKESIIETDALDTTSAAIYSQYDERGLLRLVAYFFKKHSPAEMNYEVYDKELLAVVLAFQE